MIEPQTLYQAHFSGSYPRFDQLEFEQKNLVAFAGKSNAGKSSVLNALCRNAKLARTSNSPGRTQHFVFFAVQPDVFLVDLPGYGYAKVSKHTSSEWGREVAKFIKSSAFLRGLVVISDCRRPLSPEDYQLLAFCEHYQVPMHLFLSKADKFGKLQQQKALDAIRKSIADNQQVSVSMGSAKSGKGLEAVSQWVCDHLNVSSLEGSAR